jgi:hypothetical protein
VVGNLGEIKEFDLHVYDLLGYFVKINDIFSHWKLVGFFIIDTCSGP